jgi:hypothetical protein
MFRSYSLLGFFIISIYVTGCNETFQPLTESDKFEFSMQGYLDASADTQWVRVAPVRDLIDMPPLIPSMRVTLTELETGQSTVMNDSLIQLPNGINFVNVWTTMEVKPEHSYRLVAERPDGTTSSVEVSIPADFPIPELFIPPGECWGWLTIRDVHRLADLQLVNHFTIKGLGNRVFRFPRRDGVRQEGPKTYSKRIGGARGGDPEILLPEGEVLESWRTIFVASGGPEWDDQLPYLDDMTYALPDGFSNVKNGVGYVVGILSKTIPFECDG